MFDKVYTSDQVMREVYKARHLVEDLFNYFVRHYDEVPAEYRALAGDDPLRAVTAHVAGMTDRYAINFFEDMVRSEVMERTTLRQQDSSSSTDGEESALKADSAILMRS